MNGDEPPFEGRGKERVAPREFLDPSPDINLAISVSLGQFNDFEDFFSQDSSIPDPPMGSASGVK